MDKQRCFIAIDLPQNIKKNLAEIQTRIDLDLPVKWVEETNFHLTLKFLGEIDKTQVNIVEDILKKVASHYKGFKLHIKGIGAFPSLKKPKVIWAGTFEPEGILFNIFRSVEEELVKKGFPGENRSFSPHITLGRVKNSGNISRNPQISLDGLDFIDSIFYVNQIKLMKSRLTRFGPEYSTIKSFLLKEDF